MTHETYNSQDRQTESTKGSTPDRVKFQPSSEAQSPSHVVAQSCDLKDVVVNVGRSSGKSAGEGGCTFAGHHQVPTSGSGSHDGTVWKHPCGPEVQRNVAARTGLDQLVCSEVPKVREAGPSIDDSLHRVEGGGSRTVESQGSCDSIHQGHHEGQDPSEEHHSCQSEGEGQGSQSRIPVWPGGHGSTDPSRIRTSSVGSRVWCGDRGGLGASGSSSERGRTDQAGVLGSRCEVPSNPAVEHGEHVTAGGESHSDRGQFGKSDSSVEPLESWEALVAAGDIDGPECLDRKPQPSNESRRFRYLVHKISHELTTVMRQSSARKGKCVDLFEVFCGNQSRLTQQIQSLHGAAVRFAKDRTDLMTIEGRRVLFEELCTQEPEHVWFAPECGPWSAWSNLNQTKSIELWEKIHNERMINLEQLALGIVLLRHQRSKGKHMHWEQPGRSHMFRTPLLQELYTKTMAAEFDMCNLGELTDPSTGKFIKKAMTIMTTSESMQQALHGHHCRGDHEHQVIEGSTKYAGKTISRSSFTENYPRKFVRYVAKVCLQKRVPKEKPVNWEVSEALVTRSEAPAPKRRRLSRVPAVTSSTQKHPCSHEGSEESKCKRFRIGQKTPKESQPGEKNHLWEKVLEDIAPTLPRVGRSEICEPQILQRLQELVGSQNPIKTVVGGKGMNRTTGPLKTIAKGEAPWRKMVYIHRNTGKLHGVDSWEKWDDLPNRKIVRTGFPSRVAITIFTGNPTNSPALEQLETPSSSVVKQVGLTGPEQFQGQPETVQEVSKFSGPVEKLKDEELEAQGNQHGPLFLQLSKEDPSLLMKIHKNAGHPGPDKLAYLLKQQGYRPEMIAAVSDLRCSACQAMSRPKVSRPAAIHSPCDFNDIISMDGYSWKNQLGNQFHFYHIVDHSTSFHVARYAPNRTSEHAIDAIVQSWFSWAGSPNEMLVDAATELNAESFSQFLQQNNVKCTTISTDAHWQNGKAERHGEIVAQMLSKYDLEHPIKDAHDLQVALAHCTQAKNSLSIRKGFAPEVLVLGKQTRLPGSVCSDHQLPAHALADAEHCHGLLFREQLARRETARKAYHVADNDASLRRAILRRSRPARQWYQPGEWVMIWKTGLNSGWRGPMKVVVHESSQTVWVTQNGKLFRHAPEHIRPVTAMESKTIDSTEVFQPLPNIHEQTVDGDQRYQNNSNAETIPAANQVPANDSAGSETQEASEGEPSSEPLPGVENPLGIEVMPEQTSVDAVEIPVPEEIHDELVGWHCCDVDNIENISCQKGWVGEILIHDQDIDNWRAEDQPAEMAFLASAAKRQKSEVRLRELNSAELDQFKKAKNSEINNWLSTGTVKRIFRNQIPEEQILRCRWLLTWKNVEQPAPGENDKKAKARLIVLGYLDPQLEEIPRDSPTLSKTSRMLILQMISSEGWDLMSFDVKAAFLQGTQSGRTLGVEPVPELIEAMKLKTNEICQLVKGAYGLVDAPYLWYKTLQAELVSLGFRTTPFDPCTFVLYDKTGRKPQGVLGIHVDDGLCGGNEQFMAQIQKLEQKYPFGAKKMGSFTFTGIDLHQNPDKSIELSQSKYVRGIKPIAIDVKKKTQTSLAVTEDERQALRGLIGSLQYASVHTRPDLASRLSSLQSQINSATIDTLMTANKVLHEAKRHHDVRLKIQPIAPGDIRFLAFTDASFASKKCPDSQAGSIILATHRNIEKNISCPVSPLAWGSKKIQKVVTSTLAAETMSLSSNLDQLSWIRLYWGWLYNPTDAWKHPADMLLQLPSAVATATYRVQNTLPDSVAATDCKSLYDLVTRTAPPNCQEFRTQLQTRAIKEQLSEGVKLRWVHSGAQLADSLTKIMENNFLRETLQIGRYKLNDELEVLRDRASTRNRIKWLKSEGSMDEEELVNAILLTMFVENCKSS